MRQVLRLQLIALFCACLENAESFSSLNRRHATFNRQPHTQLFAYSSNRSSNSQMASKRQERVGQLVRSELAQIIQSGTLKLGASNLEAATRQRISIVSVDVSPDLRQARVSVSIRSNPNNSEQMDEGFSPAMEQRRAYSWLVTNTKALRHSLAQRMSHMKTCPNLTFHKVDVGAAVDVMFLIDQLTDGYKRTDLDFSNPASLVTEDGFDGLVEGVDFDEELDDEDWEEEEEFV
jgi:ribosome-binding factor A